MKERLVNRQGRLTVHLDNTMIVGQKFFKKWGKLLLIYHSIEAAKARKKRRLLTQSKPVILWYIMISSPKPGEATTYIHLFVKLNWNIFGNCFFNNSVIVFKPFFPKVWKKRCSFTQYKRQYWFNQYCRLCEKNSSW